MNKKDDFSLVKNRDESFSTQSSWNTVLVFAASAYDPVPMKQPEPHSDLPYLPTGRRVAEVLIFQCENLLYILSPQGGVQAIWKLILRTIFLIVPIEITFLIVAVFLAKIMGYLALAALSLQQIAVSLLITVVCGVVIGAILLFVSSFLAKRNIQNHRRR
ncbi:MAG: hypothetical protein LBT05_09605 [Planctomycetaceae bacterium]|jgi:hypothetical protein|nr:hypothetical protein [Planctomycetaceae bacterium]